MKTKRAFDRKGRYLGWQVSATANSEEFHLNKTWGPGEGKEYKVRPNLSLESIPSRARRSVERPAEHDADRDPRSHRRDVGLL